MTLTEHLELALRNGHGAMLDAADVEELVSKLRAADDLVDHILTSESMNPELGLAEAYRDAGKGE